ncbi:DNA-binding protein [Mycobacterium tuberculosis]|nr:DNA-binding protein [Mycobacterium tuberculosis]
MTEHTPDIPLGSWLAALPDERLTQLLELRPDLAQPPPGSIAALAARAQARQSVKAATDELDFLRLAVFDALLVLQADTAPVPIVRLLAVIGDRAAQADVLGALADLKQRALAWGETAVRVATDAGTALPWHPGQVTLEGSSRSGDQLADLIAGLDPAQRDVLDKLLQGSPVGRTRDAAPGAPSDRPVPRLLAMGLLRRIDAETVILPRHVGQVLRGEQPGPMELTAPDPVVSPPHPTTPTLRRPEPSSTYCVKSTYCSKTSAPHRLPNYAAADWGFVNSSGWPRQRESTSRGWA